MFLRNDLIAEDSGFFKTMLVTRKDDHRNEGLSEPTSYPLKGPLVLWASKTVDSQRWSRKHIQEASHACSYCQKDDFLFGFGRGL